MYVLWLHLQVSPTVHRSRQPVSESTDQQSPRLDLIVACSLLLVHMVCSAARVGDLVWSPSPHWSASLLAWWTIILFSSPLWWVVIVGPHVYAWYWLSQPGWGRCKGPRVVPEHRASLLMAAAVSLCSTGASHCRDVQREIPVPSLPYGFKLFPPGNFPYGNSREIPEIREFPELREFPVLRESREFPSYGKFPFSKCTYIRFSIGFLR